ncbi:hypothetical protein BKM63_20530 [Flavobacterium johnsoniae]|uniref:Uncharacterized protein n=1 Tax=Flavobacterium johnsoniae TaxID=986 RepID=A0A1J7BNQ8_FLAJO|nr:hypothetical protein BKM63_20530 [Flavobacterium johnsoniae]
MCLLLRKTGRAVFTSWIKQRPALQQWVFIQENLKVKLKGIKAEGRSCCFYAAFYMYRNPHFCIFSDACIVNRIIEIKNALF